MSKHENSKKYFWPRFHVLIDLAFLILSVKYFLRKTRERGCIQPKLLTLKSSAIFGNIKGSRNSLSRDSVETWYFHPANIWKEIWNIFLQLLSSAPSGSVINLSRYLHISSITGSSYLLDSYKLCLAITHMWVSHIFFLSLKIDEIVWERSGNISYVCFLPLVSSSNSCNLSQRTQNKFLQDTDHN